MRKLRILLVILRRTKADKVLLGMIVFVLVSALFIMLSEPNITSYFDALWYCYTVISTIGFGDIIVTTFISKIISVLLTVYSLFVIAIATGVVVSFYNQVVQSQHDDSVSLFVDKLERLPELSKEELKEISDKIKKLR
ncbi:MULTISPECIES: potassium channel family protein [unclassified Ruminococcus]|uniref:potassium channel family protein n=1 Tax=unclassified Ruminococcus TaxID=2608920 RepID=UPI00210D04CC|nr:two pore domain potassium channel family protein [Ruminococcus sp. zg-924]MCQ4114104.1 two pore domain potassium channel family protein [Ruminococcus sp. zg-921]